MDARWPLRSPLLGPKTAEHAVDHVLRESGTRMLIINRAELLAAGKERIHREAVPFLVNLLDRGAATIVLVGDETLPNLIDYCAPLREHFWSRMSLMPVQATFDQKCPWISVLHQYEAQLPFEQGTLHVGDMPVRLYAAADGRLPALSSLVDATAMTALYTTKPPVPKLLLSHFRDSYAEIRPGKPNPFRGGLAD